MLSLKSVSARFSASPADVANSLRAGLFAAGGAFLAGAFGAIQGGLTPENLTNPKALLATAVVAGCTAVLDLIRRWAADYSA